MNRRSAWMLSAMVAGVVAIGVLTIGASSGHFGFGDGGTDGAVLPAAAQEQAAPVPAGDMLTTTGQNDNGVAYYEEEDGDDNESEGHDRDGEHGEREEGEDD